MKHSVLVLALLCACGGPSDPPNNDGGNTPAADGGMPQPRPDANPDSDINPPLTPDDPCRQLKLEFEVEILAADAALLGDVLVVAYQSETETAVATYRNDVLEHLWPLPFGQPRLFYSRDELHVTVGNANDTDGTVWEILPDSRPRVVLDEQIAIGAFWHIDGDISDADDLLILHWSSSGFYVTTLINGEYSSAGGGSTIGGSTLSGDWWPVSVGSGADAVVRSVEVYVPDPTSGVGEVLVSRQVSHPIAGGTAMSGEVGAVQLDSAFEASLISVVLETPVSAVIAADYRLVPSVEYYRTDAGSGIMETIWTTPGARIAAYGNSVGDHASGRVRAMYVEHIPTDDGLSGSWHLVEPSQQQVIAVGRSGLAGSQVNPGALIRVGSTFMWAGPTIRDGYGSNYPADAIAVCTFSL